MLSNNGGSVLPGSRSTTIVKQRGLQTRFEYFYGKV